MNGLQLVLAILILAPNSVRNDEKEEEAEKTMEEEFLQNVGSELKYRKCTHTYLHTWNVALLRNRTHPCDLESDLYWNGDESRPPLKSYR